MFALFPNAWGRLTPPRRNLVSAQTLGLRFTPSSEKYQPRLYLLNAERIDSHLCVDIMDIHVIARTQTVQPPHIDPLLGHWPRL
jgi:hypothetical protein